MTEELIERVQESTLIPQVPACDNNASVSLNTNSDRKSLPLSPLSATNSFSCRLHRTCPVPEYFISISIPTLKEVHVKGVIIDGETTTYTIHTQAKQLSRISNSAFGPLNITEKRHSDLKKLYNFICKENPDYILPPLPSYGSLTLDESKEEFRRRNFTLWLEFILNLSVVQNSADITNSFTGLQGWCNEYGMTSMISVSPSCPNMSDIFVTTMQLKRSVVLPKYLRFAKINVFKDLATISK